jgi:hypothetical protein
MINRTRLAVVFPSTLLTVLMAAMPAAEARTFSFNAFSFATLFGGSYGTSNAADTAYAHSLPAGVTVSGAVPSNASGEFGVLLSGKKANLKLSGELLMPKALSGVEGKNSGGTEYFKAESEITATLGTATIELLAYPAATSRMMVGLGYGLASVTLVNTYEMTTAGTTATGVGDFTEKATAQAPVMHGYLGYETLFTDRATVAFTLGYRECKVSGFKATGSATTFTGAQAEGQKLLNRDGSERKVNLSGAFVGLNFRFFLF